MATTYQNMGPAPAPATPTTPGTMSAADKTKLDTYPADGAAALAAKADATATTAALAGKQPGTVKLFDAAVTTAGGATVVAATTSSRLRIIASITECGVIEIKPDGAATNTNSTYTTAEGVVAAAATFYIARGDVGMAPSVAIATIEPRKGGMSGIISKQLPSSGSSNVLVRSDGTTTTDFASITVTAFTGWLTVYEETPAIGDPSTGPSDNGFTLPDVANDFDPTVAPGLAGRCGAKVGTIDGSTAWIHGVPVTDKDTPDTNWVLVG